MTFKKKKNIGLLMKISCLSSITWSLKNKYFVIFYATYCAFFYKLILLFLSGISFRSEKDAELNGRSFKPA